MDKDRTINIRLSDEDMALLNEASEITGQSKSRLIRDGTHTYLRRVVMEFRQNARNGRTGGMEV